MTVIDQIMQLEVAKWINQKVSDLPDSAKFRAASAIRSLEWASRNHHAGMPIPAAYFALHATEEAVAAFVSCAKAFGYGEDAKINLRDHRQKAIVSLLAQKISNFLARFQPAIAVDSQSDKLIVRFEADGSSKYAEASATLFTFTHGADGEPKTDFLDDVIAVLGDHRDLKQAVSDGQEGRNKILYASDDGMPTGFLDPNEALRRECHLTLGLIWGAIDIAKNQGVQIPLIAQALRTANRVLEEIQAKRSV